MDKIGHYGSPIKSGISHGVSAKKKAVVSKSASDVKKAEAAEEKGPVDGLDTSRQERIKIFLDKAHANVSDVVEMGTLTLIGQVVGTAVGMSIAGGTIPLVVGGAVGAMGGLVLHHFGWDKPVKRAVGKAVNLALTPFVLAGGLVKKGVKKAIGWIKPSKKEKAQRASIKGDGLAMKGSKGAIFVEGDATKARAGAEMEDVKKGAASKLASGIGTAVKVGRATPNIIYPAIKNANPAEAAKIMEVLDSMPLSSATSTASITVNPKLASDMGAAGLARELPFGNAIQLDTGSLNTNIFGEETLIHELGHTVDYNSVPIMRTGRSSFAPFGEGPYVYDKWIDTPNDLYAATNHWEDWAQSYKFYHEHPEVLKATNPEKFEAMDQFHKNSVYDKVLDKSGVRKAGKKLAELIDRVPGLRRTLNVAGAVLGPITLNLGAEKMQDGIKEGDIGKKYTGKMELAQGLAFTTKVLSPIGLGIALTKWIADRRIKKGKMTIEQADNFAAKVLAAMAGPLGMTYLAATNELLRSPEGKKVADFMYKERKAESKSDRLVKQLGVELYDAQRKNTRVKIDRSKTGLTGKDKVFMAKVGGGAVLGGMAGTAGGFVGGGFVGAAIGGLIGGPFGAALGGLLGKVAGSMTASYLGAKYGAKAGRMLDKESREVKIKMAEGSIEDFVEKKEIGKKPGLHPV